MIPDSVDANRVPLELLAGNIVNGSLSIGPGTISLPLNLAGVPVSASLSSTNIRASIGASSTPTLSSGQAPGYPAAENLDPALVSFASMGQGASGTICGNLAAASLAAAPIPANVASNCNQGYTSNNSLLDLLVGGCTTFSGTIVVVRATQPDAVDPAATVVGSGSPYSFQHDSQLRVTSCTDSSGGAVPLSGCLSAAAYSTYLAFATERARVVQ